MADKTKGEELSDRLLMNRKTLIEQDRSILEKADRFCEGYKAFLCNKTEREVVDYVIPILEEHGYTVYERGRKYEPGEKFYKVNRGKNILMCTKGRQPVSEGLRVTVAHIDSPRLDFKPHPLFEDSSLGFFKTHYYGGIKKYQWTTIPLSIRGVVYRKDGSKVNIKIGEGEDEPALLIPDLLIHLSQKQMQKKVSEAIEGEQLNLLMGSVPYDDEKVKSAVKLALMEILHDRYGITEDDFETAELCAVPAFIPRDSGLDRSFIAGYGQDDSSCAYAEFAAELDTFDPEYTTMTVFCDKEETGSDGVTGMRSFFFRDFVEDLAEDEGCSARDVMRNSICLSCDVGAGFDPNYPEVMERNNCCFMNCGPCISKYNGSRGKYGTSDASAELMSFVLGILRDADVQWQIGELGKIDVGGGGTISSEITVHDIDTLDIGVPVLSMHAPVEITAKADIYMLYKAVLAVYNSSASRKNRSQSAPSPAEARGGASNTEGFSPSFLQDRAAGLAEPVVGADHVPAFRAERSLILRSAGVRSSSAEDPQRDEKEEERQIERRMIDHDEPDDGRQNNGSGYRYGAPLHRSLFPQTEQNPCPSSTGDPQYGQ